MGQIEEGHYNKWLELQTLSASQSDRLYSIKHYQLDKPRRDKLDHQLIIATSFEKTCQMRRG